MDFERRGVECPLLHIVGRKFQVIVKDTGQTPVRAIYCLSYQKSQYCSLAVRTPGAPCREPSVGRDGGR